MVATNGTGMLGLVGSVVLEKVVLYWKKIIS
jgi:hypothetical protein